MNQLRQRHQFITNLIQEASNKITEERDIVREVSFKSSYKDLVTDMDKRIERYFIEEIRKFYPGEKIIAEEGQGDKLTSLEDDTVWFIDPIDGTLNYVFQQDNFAIMVAVYHKGIGMMGYIFDVNKQNMYYAIKEQGVYKNNKRLELEKKDYSLDSGLVAINSKVVTKPDYKNIRQGLDQSMGIRMRGSAAHEILGIIEEDIVAYISSSLSPWDIAPGIIMLDELDLKHSRFDGSSIDLLKNNSIIFAYPSSYQEVLAAMQKNS